VGGDGFAAADGIAAFVGAEFDVDGAAKMFREKFGHGGAMGGEFGTFGEDRYIQIGEGKSFGPDFFADVLEKEQTGGIFPAGVVVGEPLADVAPGHGAQERVDDGVDSDVAVAVGDGGHAFGDLDAGED